MFGWMIGKMYTSIHEVGPNDDTSHVKSTVYIGVTSELS